MRVTLRTMRDQTRPSTPALCSTLRPSQGTRRALTRSPIRASTAGSSVSAASTVTIPTRIAPAARLRRIVSGTSTIPTIARTKAEPLNSTARLAVEPTVAMARSFSLPRRRSSR